MQDFVKDQAATLAADTMEVVLTACEKATEALYKMGASAQMLSDFVDQFSETVLEIAEDFYSEVTESLEEEITE